MARLAGTFRKGRDPLCPRPIKNVRLPAWTLVGGPRGPTLQEVGLRAGRTGPAGPGSLFAAGSPRPSPSESEEGGGREAQAGRGGAEAARLVGGACPARAAGLRLRELPGLGDSPEMIPQSETAVGQQEVPRDRASPQQAPPGPVHPGPTGA